jgi:hypothetical protein
MAILPRPQPAFDNHNPLIAKWNVAHTELPCTTAFLRYSAVKHVTWTDFQSLACLIIVLFDYARKTHEGHIIACLCAVCVKATIGHRRAWSRLDGAFRGSRCAASACHLRCTASSYRIHDTNQCIYRLYAQMAASPSFACLQVCAVESMTPGSKSSTARERFEQSIQLGLLACHALQCSAEFMHIACTSNVSLP